MRWIIVALVGVGCASHRMEHPPLVCRAGVHETPIDLLGYQGVRLTKTFPHCRRASS